MQRIRTVQIIRKLEQNNIKPNQRDAASARELPIDQKDYLRLAENRKQNQQ